MSHRQVDVGANVKVVASAVLYAARIGRVYPEHGKWWYTSWNSQRKGETAEPFEERMVHLTTRERMKLTTLRWRIMVAGDVNEE